MGTRSLTRVIQKWEDSEGNPKRQTFVSMYRQHDGYPEGHGADLAEFLEPFTVVNGIRINEERKIANGIDCLAAQMVAHFKQDAGGIYLMHPDANDVGEEYIYEIEEDGENILLTVYDIYREEELFHGSPTEFLKYIENDKVYS